MAAVGGNEFCDTKCSTFALGVVDYGCNAAGVAVGVAAVSAASVAHASFLSGSTVDGGCEQVEDGHTLKLTPPLQPWFFDLWLL